MELGLAQDIGHFNIVQCVMDLSRLEPLTIFHLSHGEKLIAEHIVK